MPSVISPRHAPLLILIASVAMLGAAFAFEYLGGLEPCILCLYQRYPYALAIALSLAALALGAAGRRGSVPWLVGLCGATFAAGAVLAVFHVGVEQHWWRGTEACGVIGPTPTTIEELRRQIMEAPVARCDEIPWSLFGVSMAGYNALGSMVLAAMSLHAAAKLFRGRVRP